MIRPGGLQQIKSKELHTIEHSIDELLKVCLNLELIKVCPQPSYDEPGVEAPASWMIPPAGVHPDYRGSGAASGKIDPNKLGCLLSGSPAQPLSLATAPQLC